MKKWKVILWKLQAWENFWFFIPDNRDEFWWDFFVNKKNFGWAKNGDLVKAIEIQNNGKKPEVKIISIKWQTKTLNDIIIKWIFSFSNKWDWWYIDVVRIIDWKKVDKWYFIHSKNIKNAQSWDYIKAKLQKHKWKLEAVVVKILDDKREIVRGKFKDNWDFWFVIIPKQQDIFIPEKRIKNTKNWEIVDVKILDNSGRRPVWIIIWKQK